MKLKCSKCGHKDFIKNGFMKNKQRYKCKKCNCNFTEGDKRKEKGKSIEIKKIALNLYIEGMGFRAIERVLKKMGIKVSHVSIINWVKKLGKEIKNLKTKEKEKVSVVAMELDEMWHFVKKNKKNCGYGLHLIERDTNLLHSFWETGVKKLENNSGTK